MPEDGVTVEMVVVHLINSLYAAGGAERLVSEMARCCPRPPLQVITLWDSKPSLRDTIPPEMIEVVSLMPPGFANMRRAWAMLRQADVVHVHLSPAQLLGLFIRKPKLFTQHNSWNSRRHIPLMRLIDRLLYAPYDIVAGVSSAVTSDVLSWSSGTPERFRTVLNGIDLQRFRAPPRRWTRRLCEGPVRLGMVARFCAMKDHPTLLRALALLPDRFTLDLAGAGPLERQLRTLADDLGLGDRIRFRGVLSDMPAFYGSIDLYVQSSRFDGFSLVAAEAMAAGLPVLASDIDGLRDTIGDPARCFPEGDFVQLARMIDAVTGDPATYNQIAQQNTTLACRYDASRMASEYQRLYGELVAAPSARLGPVVRVPL